MQLRPIQALTRTELSAEGVGQSCAVIISQPATDPGGWLIELSAQSLHGFFLVKRLWLTKPLRIPTRVVATCTFPNARQWSASVQSPARTAWGVDVPVLPIKGTLSVSDEPFSLGELDAGQPGSRGWSYASASAPAAVTVPPGAVLREVSAVADVGGGTCTIVVPRDAVTSEALPPIPIPPGTTLRLPEETIRGVQGPATVTFAGTIAHFVAWME